ncbi:MAG TPA: response regulator [Streptosporangiaceae bacterium]|jgi:CheY-like chemotaxis protein
MLTPIVVGKLLDALPTLLWVLFATAALLLLRGPVFDKIVPRLSQVHALGVEFTLTAGHLMDKAVDTAPTAAGAETSTPAERRGAVSRLEHALPSLAGGRILWVDDVPANNRYLMELFAEAGMSVDTAASTEQAVERLERGAYDIVISDIARGDDDRAGIGMVRAFAERGIRVPVIIHAGRFDPRLGLPRGVFAATNRIDEVVQYVIDLMERARFGAPRR